MKLYENYFSNVTSCKRQLVTYQQAFSLTTHFIGLSSVGIGCPPLRALNIANRV